MDRSFFRLSQPTTTNKRDTSPLLPQHKSPNSHPLRDLAPRPYTDTPTATSSSRSKASTSPSQDSQRFRDPSSPSRFARSPPRRRSQVQFAEVPPPIVSSVAWHSPALAAAEAGVSSGLFAQQDGGRSMMASHMVSSRSVNPPVNVVNPNPMAALQRREKAIQKELQILLDAQSSGLVHGTIGPGPGTEDSVYEGSEGSRTPTRAGSEGTRSRSGDGRSHSQSYGIRKDTGGVIPVRQPKKKKISLRGARRGIAASISDLHTLKSHEYDITKQTVIELHTYEKQVSKWETKLGSFTTSINEISSGSESREISELQTEKGAVVTEIRDLEDRLLGLKARDRHLEAQIHELENRKEAKVSSYKEGRRGVEGQVKEFLRRPLPEDVVMLLPAQAVGGGEWGNGPQGEGTNDQDADGEGAMFLALPPKRRTLEMAKAFLSGCIKGMEKQSEEIEKERIALDEGARMWEDGVAQVVTFEEDLYLEMKADATALKEMSKSKAKSRLDNDSREEQATALSKMQARVSKMDAIIQDLEGKVQKAESEGWNLLICALGAEMEAFREGRGILQQVLTGMGLMENEKGSSDIEDDHGHGLDELNDTMAKTVVSNEGNGNGSEGLGIRDDNKHKEDGDGDGESEREREAVYRSETESEDDGPHPDLLVSADDEDVE